MQCQVVFFD